MVRPFIIFKQVLSYFCYIHTQFAERNYKLKIRLSNSIGYSIIDPFAKGNIFSDIICENN